MRADNPLHRSCRTAARKCSIPAPLPPAALILALAGCTSVGMHAQHAPGAAEFGEREELRICVLADADISEKKARRLIAKVGKELSMFGIEVTVPWVRQWDRPAFLMHGIVADLWRQPLEAPCDRLLALVGRNFGDFLWGLLGIEVLGAVDTPTHSRGYVIAKTRSLNQLISSPTETAIHETYHLLGCNHDASLSNCYTRIRDLKRIARANRESGAEFFPAVSLNGLPIQSRHHVNLMMNDAIRLAQLPSRSEPDR